MLDEYRKNKGNWPKYEHDFNRLMEERKPETKLQKDFLDGACLLCSEASPTKCHRRLAAEYLKEKLGDVEIVHII